ncbi:MAG: TetR/AcrR family transcriptional regulator [Dehalococcoidia bacterium]
MADVVSLDRSEQSRVAMRKQRTRAAILQAAEELFSVRGYDATTMQEIATLAEVGLGTMYGYFPSKEDVLRTVLEGKRHEVAARARQALESADDAVDRACIILRHTWYYFHENRQMAIALIAFDANQREGAPLTQNETYQALLNTLQAGQKRGQLAAVPLETTAKSLLSVYIWAALQLGLWRQGTEPEAALRDLELLTRRQLGTG